jgi:hypothetical protein
MSESETPTWAIWDTGKDGQILAVGSASLSAYVQRIAEHQMPEPESEAE